ncbi:MAG: XdhC/CoxI family protein [Sphingobacteriales bacterium]|nr:MAG: XdhC/CoxI family protein [Sphingobacteriales bacterium]
MKVWQFIKHNAEASVNVMLLYVLESSGSSPGRQGFCMAVAHSGEICGSIGGGIMEHKFVEMAKARLADGENIKTVHKQIHDKAAGKNQSGMICSGEQTIFLHQVTKQDLKAVDALIQSLQANQNGTLQLSPQGIFFSNEIPANNFLFEQYDENDFLLQEKTGYKNKLHIIGGGHCALAFSKLMRDMDFYITVYEERKDLNTMSENIFAHEKFVIESYNELSNLISGGENVYVVIMTFGYRTDDIAVRALLGKECRYIGLLGSRKKIEKLFTEYEHSDLDKKALSEIHSPIGLPIKSQTPEEIAISIAAEIIAQKNRYQ